MNLRLQIDGKDRFDWAVDMLGQKMQDLRSVWPEIEMIYSRVTLDQFNTEGGHGGGRWVPLSEKYAAWKQKKYPGAPILVRTGRLRRSLTVIGAGSADQVKEETAHSLTLGSLVPYGIFHQRGTKRMAQRPPMEFTRNDMGKMTSRIYRFLERGARDAGFKTTTQPFYVPGAGA